MVFRRAKSLIAPSRSSEFRTGFPFPNEHDPTCGILAGMKLDESQGQAILRVLRQAGRCLTANEIAARLNAEGQETSWGNPLVDANAAKLPELYSHQGKWCVKNDTTDLISECEKRERWQATARHSIGYLVALMRGRDQEPFTGNFYLYDEHYQPEQYHPATGGLPAYSVEQIGAMFTSGELILLRGIIPE
jgi:hypothetical protein